MKKIASGAAEWEWWQRRGRRHSGQVEAVALYGPERARLSELWGVAFSLHGSIDSHVTVLSNFLARSPLPPQEKVCVL